MSELSDSTDHQPDLTASIDNGDMTRLLGFFGGANALAIAAMRYFGGENILSFSQSQAELIKDYMNQACLSIPAVWVALFISLPVSDTRTSLADVIGEKWSNRIPDSLKKVMAAPFAALGNWIAFGNIHGRVQEVLELKD